MSHSKKPIRSFFKKKKKSLVLDITFEMSMRPLSRVVIHVGRLKFTEVRARDINLGAVSI